MTVNSQLWVPFSSTLFIRLYEEINRTNARENNGVYSNHCVGVAPDNYSWNSTNGYDPPTVNLLIIIHEDASTDDVSKTFHVGSIWFSFYLYAFYSCIRVHSIRTSFISLLLNLLQSTKIWLNHLVRAKGVRMNETRHDRSNLITSKLQLMLACLLF